MEKISPEEYREILDGIQLENLFVKALKSQVDHTLFSEGMTISIRDKASYSNVEDGFTVEHKYTLASKNEEKKTAIKIECTYVLAFSSENDISDEFFEIYKDISLPLNVWPFFRELVHSITTRMNIPPLTLPLLKR